MRLPQLRVAAASAAVLTLFAGLLGPAAPASAASTVQIVPAQLDRGEDIRVPHVQGSRIVDGERRITVDASYVGLLGTSGRSYVVVASGSDEWRGARVLRVRRDGTTKTLARRVRIGEVELSDDGSRLALTRSTHRGPTRTVIRVLDARTGDLVDRIRQRGWVEVLDADAHRVLLSRWEPARTQVWRPGRARPRTVLRHPAHVGDLDTNRMAWFTGDPYADGCTEVGRIDRPRRVLWRSCRDRVHSFSPDGRQMVTLHKLTDGVGPRLLKLREVRGGEKIARYSINGWFTEIRWEDETTVLLGANARRRFATVRCEATDCERASRLRPSTSVRTPA